MKNSDQARNTAEARFKKKEQQRSEAKKAMSEYEAANRAEDAKTARLRALRLARDAAIASAPPPAKKTSKKKVATDQPA
jgi:hypothetical protein